MSGVLTITERHTIGRYLGIEHIISRSRPVIVKELFTRANGKLAVWKRRTLSKARRLVLTRAKLAQGRFDGT